MSTTTLARAWGGGLALAGLLILGGGTASATAAPEPPADVTAFLAGPAVEEIQASVADAARQAAGGGPQSRALTAIGEDVPDFSGEVSAGPAHQVSSFTDEFLAGSADGPPTRTTQQWLAALGRDGEAIGTARVWKPDGAPAELAVYNDDAVLGGSLLFDDPTVVIEDETISTFYRLDGAVLTPLPASSRTEFAGPVDLREAQVAIAARYRDAIAESARMSAAGDGTDSPVGGFALASPASAPPSWSTRAGVLTGGLLVLAGSMGAALVLLRHRRAAAEG